MTAKKDLLTIWDFSAEEVRSILNRSIALKSGVDRMKCPLIGKSIGLFFEKPSTRTRVSFEVGVYQLGAQPIVLSPRELQLGRGETIADTARTLSRYLHGMVMRVFQHDTVAEFARHASIPVINGLSNAHHPCQAFADVMTVQERKGRTDGIRFAFIGDGNNVAHSLIEIAARTGLDFVIAAPEGYDPDPAVVQRARSAGGRIAIVRDAREAAAGADVLYTDVWVSMGQEAEADEKVEKFRSFQINDDLLGRAKPDAMVLHCLPAVRGNEITDAVMDGPHSAIFAQAENRLHTEKALLEYLVS
ncbi:MAG: ornithine carbamoyltransferase [Nitrospiraceae bacterium]|jgi:ornithine carbamoyltransferase|nr:ornithine carbamoyltransferase [Nitrospiraceae bacterium]